MAKMTVGMTKLPNFKGRMQLDRSTGAVLFRFFESARKAANEYWPSKAKPSKRRRCSERAKRQQETSREDTRVKPTRAASDNRNRSRKRKRRKFVLADPDTRVIIGDCRGVLPTIKTGSIDCVFADQPYNIGVQYKDWDDNLPEQEFWDFTFEWVDLCIETLAPTGSLFAWLPPNIANRVAVHLEQRGMFLVNDIVVVQRFGQHRTTNFISGHVRLLYFAKNREQRVWNADDILVPSLRETKYKDKRTKHTKNPGKRVPFDVWGIDEQYFGRVSGAHSNKERRSLHPNQVPEVVVKRALLATTNPGDLVLDPFAGSGTTGTVARALGRRSISIEISQEYAKSAFERMKEGAVRV